MNRTTVQPPTALPWRSRRVLTRRRSSLTGSWADRRTSVRRSTINFTSGTPVNNPCKLAKSAVSVGRTTMSVATSGNDREGRSSRSWPTWLSVQRKRARRTSARWASTRPSAICPPRPRMHAVEPVRSIDRVGGSRSDAPDYWFSTAMVSRSRNASTDSSASLSNRKRPTRSSTEGDILVLALGSA